MCDKAESVGISVRLKRRDGEKVSAGETIAELTGTPASIISGEDLLLGFIAKPSGVATAARLSRERAGRIRVVCGGWKKVPAENKALLRGAVEAGGIKSRILPEPFLYIDKNYIRLLGSIEGAMNAAKAFPERAVAIQVRGETAPIEDEALRAARLGACVIMVDTGKIDDLRKCSAILRQNDLRRQLELSLAGGIRLEDLPGLNAEDIDVVDVGRSILDAAMLDIRYDILRQNGRKAQKSK
jgi:nicotinate-nucleotide pyrophosphorylase (carboxylating)